MCMSNAEYIRELCVQYIRAIEQGIEGDFYRMKIHEKLIERTLIPEDKLKDILHNLDKVIGYMPPVGETMVGVYGDKLFNAIKHESMRIVHDMLNSDGDVKVFLKKNGYSIVDWVEEWAECMLLDNNKVPMLQCDGCVSRGG